MNYTVEMAYNPSFLGKAGEYAVASQLLTRGILVHFPAVDEGVDLIAGGRLRIQVKSRRAENCRVSGYNFTLGQKRDSYRIPKSRENVRARRMRELFPHVDYLICWGMNDDIFWVLPSSVLGQYPAVQSLLLGSRHKRYADYGEILRRHKAGERNCDIAVALDIHPVTVSEVIRGRVSKINPAAMLSIEADKYENYWDGIIEDLKLLDQVETADEIAEEV